MTHQTPLTDLFFIPCQLNDHLYDAEIETETLIVLLVLMQNPQCIARLYPQDDGPCDCANAEECSCEYK